MNDVRAEFEKKWPVPKGCKYYAPTDTYSSEEMFYKPRIEYNNVYDGYKSRQPEIDQLKEEKERLRESKVLSKDEFISVAKIVEIHIQKNKSYKASIRLGGFTERFVEAYKDYLAQLKGGE